MDNENDLENYISKELDHRWLDFSSALQPRWQHKVTRGRAEVEMIIKSGQMVVTLTDAKEGIAIRFPDEPIVVWSAIQNKDRYIVQYGPWQPSTEYITTSDRCTPWGVVISSKFIDEAIVTVTNAMSLQFNRVRTSLNNETVKPGFLQTDPVRINDATKDSPDALIRRLNGDLERQEMIAKMGNFLLAWQDLELQIRVLMLKVEANGRALLEIYTPDRSSLTNRVESVIQRMDKDLYVRIGQMVRHRNNLIHGVSYAHQNPDIEHVKAVIGHQDLVATALIAAWEPDNVHHIMVPVNSGVYRSEEITSLTNTTTALVERIANLAADESALARYRQEKTSTTRKGRRKKRSRSKGKK